MPPSLFATDEVSIRKIGDDVILSRHPRDSSDRLRT